ncbi:hypothetical protein [Rhodohalobacter sp. 8-1]|uniref:hypothetical protein n=1 Tax=Rhodohalobacter sp. 8-1 TaxID=3131972 RepID=UPI0030EE9F70
MKSVYSIILLLPFDTAVLQPVMPMAEYVVSKINLVDLFDSNGKFDVIAGGKENIKLILFLTAAVLPGILAAFYMVT